MDHKFLSVSVIFVLYRENSDSFTVETSLIRTPKIRAPPSNGQLLNSRVNQIRGGAVGVASR